MQVRKSIFFLFAGGFQLDNGVTSPCPQYLELVQHEWDWEETKFGVIERLFNIEGTCTIRAPLQEPWI